MGQRSAVGVELADDVPGDLPVAARDTPAAVQCRTTDHRDDHSAEAGVAPESPVRVLLRGAGCFRGHVHHSRAETQKSSPIQTRHRDRVIPEVRSARCGQGEPWRRK